MFLEAIDKALLVLDIWLLIDLSCFFPVIPVVRSIKTSFSSTHIFIVRYRNARCLISDFIKYFRQATRLFVRLARIWRYANLDHQSLFIHLYTVNVSCEPSILLPCRASSSTCIDIFISPPSIASAPADEPATILGHGGLFELHTKSDWLWKCFRLNYTSL